MYNEVQEMNGKKRNLFFVHFFYALKFLFLHFIDIF